MNDVYFNMDVKSTNVRDKNMRRKTISGLLRIVSNVAPGLTRWLAMRLFFSPRRYRVDDDEQALIRKGRPFKFHIHDKTIRGWRWGEGPEVLMIHGWNGSGAQFKRFVEPLVSAGFTAVAIDGPAHGKSTGKMTSYFEFTDALRKILKDESNFNIMGIIAHSFGAAAAINALVKEKKAVKTVCIAPALKLKELIYHAFDQYGIPAWYYLSLIHDFEKRYGYHLDTDNPHRLMRELSAPVLIAHDIDDRTVPHEDSEQQAKRQGDIALWSSKGLGHSGILQDQEVIQRCVAHLAA